jgi:acyl-CoA synthetase (NDP forming)/GNAT superfamily N-acetyltransferase
MNMMPTAAASCAYALLTDGTTTEIRPATPDDVAAVRALHEALPIDSAYQRLFSLTRPDAQHEAQRICRAPGPDHAALVAACELGIIGAAAYETVGRPDMAEVSVVVADDMQGRGVATLLLEHLGSIARRQGVRTFIAPVLTTNTQMLKVLADTGLRIRWQLTDDVLEVRVDLPCDDADPGWEPYLDAVGKRESLADIASLRHIFRPASVAVIGAGRRTGSVGRTILRNIVTGGFAGPVYAVNPHAASLDGVPCFSSVNDLPEAPDLAVVAVPPSAVPGVAGQCGRRGVKALVVITAGLDDALGGELLATCRGYGMRLVGPNCFGVAAPGMGLDATFAARHPAAGNIGLVMQSGGLGFAVVDRLSGLGLGISSFASVGNKYDVSANDMLMWWEHDGLTRLAVLYIESFGNPRKFARTARRVSQVMPVLTVHAGRSAAGQRAAASHTAAVATPLASRQALFAQAGIIATGSLSELIEVAALLATQPVPAGRNVAIISNVGGAGVLAADACADLGLAVHTPGTAARCQLQAVVPPGGSVTGPVDTTAAVTGEDFRRCLELVGADPGADAVLALVLPTGATGDLMTAITGADVAVPLAAVALDQAESVRLLARTGGSSRAGTIPCYAYPEAAAGALARAAAYGAWRARPYGHIPALPGLQPGDARQVIGAFLGRLPDGGWLSPDESARLLGCYGIPLAALQPVASEEAAASAAAACGGPVVLKADVPGLLHKTEAGAVELDLRTADEVRRAYRRLTARFGDRPHRVLIQPMTGGTEVIVGVTADPVFGSLVVFGLGGVATEVLGDHAARLTPLTSADADELISAIRSAPLLEGYRGAPAADHAALRDLLLRVSRLAGDLPEVTELDLNPVIARPDGVVVVDVRIRVQPREPEDPFLRRLR